MKFNVHGDYNFEFVDNILIIRVVGSWNEEAAIQFSDALKEIVVRLDDKPWGNILNMTEWDLSIPEIWNVLGETAIWLMDHNHKFEAVVATHAIEKHLMNQRFESTPNLKKAFFRDEVEALKWCREQQNGF